MVAQEASTISPVHEDSLTHSLTTGGQKRPFRRPRGRGLGSGHGKPSESTARSFREATAGPRYSPSPTVSPNTPPAYQPGQVPWVLQQRAMERVKNLAEALKTVTEQLKK